MSLSFNEQGFLVPAVPVKVTIQQIEEIFVNNKRLEASKTRRNLFNNYKIWLEKFHHEVCEKDFIQWIDGSFATLKQHPEDIDIVTFLDHSVYKSVEPKLSAYVDSSYHKATGLDCYFVSVYPGDHPKHFIYESDRKTWLSDFSAFRDKRKRSTRQGSKGFLEIQF